MKSRLLFLALAIAALFLITNSETKAQTLTDATINYSYDNPYNELTSYFYQYNNMRYYYSVTVNMGDFNFKFDNRWYNRFRIYANGAIYPFKNSYPYLCNRGYPDYYMYYPYDEWLTRNRPAIYPFYYYNMGYYGSGAKQLRLAMEGTAPNRIFKVQWKDFDLYSYGAGYVERVNVQAWLYETSNIIEFRYGAMENWDQHTFDYPWYTRGYYWVGIGFAACDNLFSPITGETEQEYINIYGNENGIPIVPHYSTKAPLPHRGYKAIRDYASFQAIRQGLMIQLLAYPDLIGAYPNYPSEEKEIFARGSVYTGDRHPKMFFNQSDAESNPLSVYYQISGPMPKTNPDYKVIYTAHEPGNPDNELYTFPVQPEGRPCSAEINTAKGIAAGTNGALDLQTNQTQIPGGEYIVEYSMALLNDAGDIFYTQQGVTQEFIIALAEDLSTFALLTPKHKDDKKYPLASTIPIQARFANVGLDPVGEFEATVSIYKDGATVYEESQTWEAGSCNDALTTGEKVLLFFDSFRPTSVGDHKVVVYADFLNKYNEDCELVFATDDEETNNYFPKTGQPDFYFEVAYNTEASADAFYTTSDESRWGDPIYQGIPFFPHGLFSNNGVGDLSEIPVNCTITFGGNEVYNKSGEIESIALSKYSNSTLYRFTQEFVPTQPGTYTVTLTINANGDGKPENDTYTTTFTVLGAMDGTYTISENGSGDRNFESIREAVDALYIRGVVGDVKFVLTDTEYTVGSSMGGNPEPALDLRSKISGVSEENTITFEPSTALKTISGGIEIKMYSEGGVGMMFGNTAQPFNANAPVYKVRNDTKKDWAVSAGHITFDGGPQRAFKFTLETFTSDLNIPFYLGDGASNISIVNSKIINTDGNFACDIPTITFDASTNSFNYEYDYVAPGVEVEADQVAHYSAGVALRSMPPVNVETGTNLFNVPIKATANNTIHNNEISGYGYGIVSLGLAPQLNSETNKYERMYNKDNKISKNQIHNVARAGIFLGNEESSSISYNRIYHVTGSCGMETAGILAGGMADEETLGYNNVAIEIDGNEISDINSAYSSYGIKVVQDRVDLSDESGQVSFPNKDEAVRVMNNSIWGIYTTDASANKIGIALGTERGNDLLTPKFDKYFTRGDFVVNNTVIIEDDYYENTGVLAAFAFANTEGLNFQNNAIAVMDENISSDSDFATAVYYNSVWPEDGGMHSDRNAYWVEDPSEVTLFRFVEIDDASEIVEYGEKMEYGSLAQWYIWTGADENSVYGDFTEELEYLGTTPKRMRIVSDPYYPKGSILSNRGNRFSEVSRDIAGNLRGVAEQRYDIGAEEFEGRLYQTDGEVALITSPAAYRSGEGLFNDAEYVMTESPVNVTARVRNNGSVQLTDIQATVEIFVETPSGTWASTPEVTKNININVESTETKDIDFMLTDGSTLFQPQTYGELSSAGYRVPDHFESMKANVTPKYKIVVTIQDDEVNENNRREKVVRFYLLRSELRVLISAENSFSDVAFADEDNPTLAEQDKAAGRLNFDAIVGAFEDLGWYVTIGEDRHDIDVFDRNAWEERSVDYTMYRSLFWSDGNDVDQAGNNKVLSRYQRNNIMDFLNDKEDLTKKNLVISGQEFVRNNNDEPKGELFIKTAVRAEEYTTAELAAMKLHNTTNDTYHPEVGVPNVATGAAISSGLSLGIDATDVTGDAAPWWEIMKLNNESTFRGVARMGHYFAEKENLDGEEMIPNNKIFSVATTAIEFNVLYFGADWRHFNDAELLLRNIFDFIVANGGSIVPVELYSFDAKQVGSQVELIWQTISENESSHFDIERADEGSTNFTVIGQLDAAGKSGVIVNYGPVIDSDVELGNTYVYRLKMVDRNGEFDYSEEKVVTLTTIDGSLWFSEAMPNPSADEARFNYTLSNAMNLDIALYDIGGKKIKNIFNGEKPAGQNEITIDVKELAAGVYTLVVKANGANITRQINVVK